MVLQRGLGRWARLVGSQRLGWHHSNQPFSVGTLFCAVHSYQKAKSGRFFEDASDK